MQNRNRLAKLLNSYSKTKIIEQIANEKEKYWWVLDIPFGQKQKK